MSNKKIYYWDTSALLTLVFHEPQSKTVRSFVETELSLPGFTSFFTLVEMESALNRRVAENSLLSEMAEVRLQMRRLEAGLVLVWPTQQILTDCRKYILEFSLRPGDSLQLSSSLAVSREGSIHFVSLDERLNKSAKASRLNCVF